MKNSDSANTHIAEEIGLSSLQSDITFQISTDQQVLAEEYFVLLLHGTALLEDRPSACVSTEPILWGADVLAVL